MIWADSIWFSAQFKLVLMLPSALNPPSASWSLYLAQCNYYTAAHFSWCEGVLCDIFTVISALVQALMEWLACCDSAGLVKSFSSFQCPPTFYFVLLHLSFPPTVPGMLSFQAASQQLSSQPPPFLCFSPPSVSLWPNRSLRVCKMQCKLSAYSTHSHWDEW